MQSDSSTLPLPLSHVGVHGPFLIIASRPPIRFDVRAVDRIGTASAQLVLSIGDLDVALAIADGSDAADGIASQLAPYARCAPITRSDVYQDAKRRLENRGATNSATQDYALLVGEEIVSVQGDYLHIGRVSFKISDVEELAEVGANLSLPSGETLQAALAALVLAAGRRDGEQKEDYALLEKRLAEYEATLREGPVRG